MRPISGFMDHDYPPVIQQHILTEHLYSIAHNAPIPPELNEMLSRKFSKISCPCTYVFALIFSSPEFVFVEGEPKTCHMGVFAEIFRAWMTIESDLYMWDFRDG